LRTNVVDRVVNGWDRDERRGKALAAISVVAGEDAAEGGGGVSLSIASERGWFTAPVDQRV